MRLVILGVLVGITVSSCADNCKEYRYCGASCEPQCVEKTKKTMVAIAEGSEDRSKNTRLVRELTNQYCPHKAVSVSTLMWVEGLKDGLDRKEKISESHNYLEGYEVGVKN